ETVMPSTLNRRVDRCFFETALLSPARVPGLAGTGHDHQLARRHDAELVMIAGAVRRWRLTDELGEAGGEGAQTPPADREAHVRHGQVAAPQQRLRPFDA